MASSSTSSSKRRFAVKLFLFLALLFALDAGIGSLLRVFYFRQKSGLNFRTTFAIDHSTDDILVLGSSRAQSNYVPTVLEEVLGRSCYNAGRDGQSLLFAHAVQEAVLKRHKPDVVVLDLIMSDFYKNSAHYDRLSVLLPYYDTHEEIQPIVNLRSRFEPIKVHSHIYPFNSLPLQILKYNMVRGKEFSGHVPQYGELSLPLSASDFKIPAWVGRDIDPNMIQSLEDVVANCTKFNIQLFVIISPVYEGTILGRAAIKDVAEVLDRSPFQLWDYSDYPEFVNNSKLFHDKGHMNNVGADLFTRMIGERILTTQPAEPRL